MYKHIHTHIYIYIYFDTHIHIFIHIHCIHSYISIVSIHTYAYIHTYIHILFASIEFWNPMSGTHTLPSLLRLALQTTFLDLSGVFLIVWRLENCLSCSPFTLACLFLGTALISPLLRFAQVTDWSRSRTDISTYYGIAFCPFIIIQSHFDFACVLDGYTRQSCGRSDRLLAWTNSYSERCGGPCGQVVINCWQDPELLSSLIERVERYP